MGVREQPRVRTTATVAAIQPGLYDNTDDLAAARVTDFTVSPVPYQDAVAFVAHHHYSGGMGAGPVTFGLWHHHTLIGVCAFHTPMAETVRAAPFGPQHVDRVTELHRLVLLDDAPRNSESWFIVRALRALKAHRPQTWAVLSYADSTAGHVGTIYQATNALYTGTADPRTAWQDDSGRLRPSRQDGVTITHARGDASGWTRQKRGVKHRYLFLTPNSRAHRRHLQSALLLPTLPYPYIPIIEDTQMTEPVNDQITGAADPALNAGVLPTDPDVISGATPQIREAALQARPDLRPEVERLLAAADRTAPPQ